MALLEFSLLAFISLLLIINPLSSVPVFLAMTQGETARERSRKAFVACTCSTGCLIGIALTGSWIFRTLSITIPAFQIAGGIVLSLIAIEMLQRSQEEGSRSSEEYIHSRSGDVAIIPLSIPLLCGPGAVTTVILLKSRVEDLSQSFTLYASIVGVYIVCFAVFHAAAYGAKWISPVALQILRRLVGLLFLTVAVQFILDAFGELGIVEHTLTSPDSALSTE